ncbi:MAG: DPP IV N-terminal domain-containing protein [Novosphingobium sp.]
MLPLKAPLRWTSVLPGFLLMSWNALPAAAQPFDGSTATLIAIDANGAGDGSASADGRFIAASSTRLHGQSAIWLFDRQTGNWRQLTEVGNGDREPAVSPDGRFVIFVSDRNGQTDLWAVDVASKHEFRVTNDSVEEEYPAWSHDGRQLVYTGKGTRAIFWKSIRSNIPAARSPREDGGIINPTSRRTDGSPSLSSATKAMSSVSCPREAGAIHSRAHPFRAVGRNSSRAGVKSSITGRSAKARA